LQLLSGCYVDHTDKISVNEFFRCSQRLLDAIRAQMAIEKSKDISEKSGAELDLRELCRFTGCYEFIGSDTTATQTRRGNQGEDPGSKQRAFPNSG
jgi:hypothetical protein